MDTEKQVDRFTTLAPTAFVVVVLAAVTGGGVWTLARGVRESVIEELSFIFDAQQERIRALRTRIIRYECKEDFRASDVQPTVDELTECQEKRIRQMLLLDQVQK